MAQWAKELAMKACGSEFRPSAPKQNLGAVACICNPSGGGRVKTGRSQGPAGQLV